MLASRSARDRLARTSARLTRALRVPRASLTLASACPTQGVGSRLKLWAQCLRPRFRIQCMSQNLACEIAHVESRRFLVDGQRLEIDIRRIRLRRIHTHSLWL